MQITVQLRLPVTLGNKMPANSFRDCVLEQLATLVGLRCNRMFGGHGLYNGEIFFGIVYNGRLYFKTHPDTLTDYLVCHAAVFVPPKKQILNNSREIPANVPEDAAQLALWAVRS